MRIASARFVRLEGVLAAAFVIPEVGQRETYTDIRLQVYLSLSLVQYLGHSPLEGVNLIPPGTHQRK